MKQETTTNAPVRPDDPRAFFGRRVGKGLRAGQRNLIAADLPALSIALPETGLLNPKNLFDHPTRIAFEIGYGGGEHLVRLAGERPADGFIGCEVYSGGIAKILQTIADNKVSNIALFADDAIKLLGVLKPASLDDIYLLYPDPWPKTRHRKRRFISSHTVAELARTLKPGGRLFFATDIKDYATWTLNHLKASRAFDLPPDAATSAHAPFEGWRPTRYEQKARRQGRLQSLYYRFVRNQSSSPPGEQSSSPPGETE